MVYGSRFRSKKLKQEGRLANMQTPGAENAMLKKRVAGYTDGRKIRRW